jgi:hypothetical protein
MEITGRIIAVLPVQGGISKNGNEWKKQEKDFQQFGKDVCSRVVTLDPVSVSLSVQTVSTRQPYSPEKNLQYFST